MISHALRKTSAKVLKKGEIDPLAATCVSHVCVLFLDLCCCASSVVVREIRIDAY